MFKTKSGEQLALPEGKRAASKYLADMIQNRGELPDGDSMAWDEFYPVLHKAWEEVEDVIALPNISQTLSTTFETILTEPVNPITNIPNLFTEMRTEHLTTNVIVGAIGSGVQADDVGEQGNYPEVDFTFGGGMQVATVGKCGIQASYTEESLKYSSWDIWGINLRIMSDALWRHKANKGIAFMLSLGTTLYNNLDPTESLYGVLKGRGIDMAANGSLDPDSLLRAMAHMHQEGYFADTLVISPMHFFAWIQDPVMRSLFLSAGQGSYFNLYSGNPGPLAPFSNGAIGKMGQSLGNKVTPAAAANGGTASGISGREHGMNAQFNIPSYFPFSLNIMVDPSVPFDAERNLGHMFLVSSGNVGALLVDEEVRQIEWEDMSRERKTVRLRERYAYAIMNEGQGLGILKNIPATPNWFDGRVVAQTLEVLSEIDADTDLSAAL